MRVIATHLRRLISGLLLAVMLATLFTPSFGWSAVGGSVAHDHAEVLPGYGAASHDADCHGHPELVRDGQSQEALDGTADLSQHCCPGHVLGHLLAGVGDWLVWPVVSGAQPGLELAASVFMSRVPEGLERPPRFAA